MGMGACFKRTKGSAVVAGGVAMMLLLLLALAVSCFLLLCSQGTTLHTLCSCSRRVFIFSESIDRHHEAKVHKVPYHTIDSPLAREEAGGRRRDLFVV